jgi:uncharacterized protein
MKHSRLWLIVSAFCLLLAAVVWGQQAVPPLSGRVMDMTATLSPEEVAGLDRTLAGLEHSRGSQIAVLIVPTTDPEEIEQYSIRVAERWKIGRGGIEDGVIVIVAKNDRRVRLEVGYGLEGAVPDAIAKRIISEQILPNFKSGDYYAGISAGIAALSRVIEGEPLPPPERSMARGASGEQELPFPILMAIFLIFWLAGPLTSMLGDFMSASLLGGVVLFVSLPLAPLFQTLIVAGLTFVVVFFLGHLFGQISVARSGGRYYGPAGWGPLMRSGSGSTIFRGGGGGFGGGGASGSW